MSHFIAWDGEGVNNEYRILQNSEGLLLRKGIEGKCPKCPCLCIHDVLPALYKSQGEMITNVWFRSRYDWDSLFKYCTRQERLDYIHGQVIIDGYKVQVTPNKIMRILRGEGNPTTWHYDTYGFFQCSFMEALRDWKIPIPQVIEEGKAQRANFHEWNESKIIRYNGMECSLLVKICEALETSLLSVKALIGGELKSWHGAGAIARVMFDAWNVHPIVKGWSQSGSTMEQKMYVEITRTLLDAYFGGRIELFRRGEYGPIYNYDINSAYPSATRDLPDMRTCTWKKVSGSEALDYNFGLVNVSWDIKNTDIIGPLPFRIDPSKWKIPGERAGSSTIDENTVVFPLKGSGAYHLIEIKEALKKNLWNIDLLDGWVIQNDYDKPFEDKINALMTERLRLKKLKDFGNKPLKLGANSFYGKFAETYEDTRTYGTYNNLLFASYITSWTRAQLLHYVKPEGAILLCTDGIYSTEPLNCPIGENLGQWEFEKYSTGKFILPGIYKVDETLRTRGYPKGEAFNFDSIYAQVTAGRVPIVKDNMFIGIRRSLKMYRKFPLCGFYDFPKSVNWNSPKRHWLGRENSACPSVYQERSKPYDPFGDRDPDQTALDLWSDTYEA